MWLLWLVIGIAFAIAEIAYSGFFLMWFCVGAFASLITSLFTSSIPIQLGVFLIVSFILLITLTKRFTTQFSHKNSIPTNIDALIGKKGIVLEAITSSTCGVGQVKLDGEIWSAITLDNTSIEKGATVIIEEIRGVRLVVTPKKDEAYLSKES
ncbi:MAG: NfeD family protein [Clostridiales bacterium]|jgi:membrane protein implicated in regulation of membrane protease activity|uniref:NfeD family protein n=1 Tax=Zhenhengia yiwuensis TaxID=2763666 RepID=A0A926I969_9FIRM|nr:NfeD family protein [Zhenhengia yiwuensis]MBC8579470.1 NfeD family protein [Zhenhengia yiwuensis]MBS5315842.1 NfeD family protein [Clostridiales bacterium]MDU6360771.1 NfeD family protein [Clostridiales bacterium]